MRKLIALLLCGVLVLGCAACTNNKGADTPHPDSTDSTKENYEKTYVDNLTVNKFINDLYNKGDLQLLGTSRGTNEGEYILYTNNCEVTLSSTEYGLYMDICGGKTDQNLENAISLFRYFTKVADSGVNAERLDEAANMMKIKDGHFNDYRVSNYVKILRFRALISEPTVSADCHIEMLLLNYLPIIEEE